MRGLVCILVSLTLLPLALPVSSAFFHDPDAYPYTVSWRAPADHTGDIALRFTVDFGAANHCYMMQEFASGGGDSSLSFMASSDRGGVTAGWSSQLVHAHLGDVDTHTVTSSGGGFGLRVGGTGSASGTETITMTVFDGMSFSFSDGPWGPLAFEFACANPVTVGDFAGSTQAIGFTQQDFEGTSVAVNAIFYGASANLGGSLAGSFATEGVTLTALHSGSVDGALSATGPEGTTSFAFGATPQWQTFGTSGPGGDWSLGLDRIGGPEGDYLFGHLAGFDPVDTPDDLF